MATRARSPQEIRASIEQNRVELGTSLEKLRVEVVRLTDWRGQLRQHQQQAAIAPSGGVSAAVKVNPVEVGQTPVLARCHLPLHAELAVVGV